MAELAGFLVVAAVVICTPGQDTALTIKNALRGEARRRAVVAGPLRRQLRLRVAAARG